MKKKEDRTHMNLYSHKSYENDTIFCWRQARHTQLQVSEWVSEKNKNDDINNKNCFVSAI